MYSLWKIWKLFKAKGKNYVLFYHSEVAGFNILFVFPFCLFFMYTNIHIAKSVYKQGGTK